MSKKYTIPGDLGKLEYVVTERDSKGHVLMLEIPYPVSGEMMTTYIVSRQGKEIGVERFSWPDERHKCMLSRGDRQKLLALFREIDKFGPPSDVPGPHNELIVTEAV